MLIEKAVVRRQRRKEGQVLSIDLGSGRFAAAIVMAEPLMAFFTDICEGELHGDDFLARRPDFIVMVMNRAVTSGIWKIVRETELPDRFRYPPKFCKKDMISGLEYIYHEVANLAPSYERIAYPGECQGLEAAAVWDAEHVEDRLRDHIEGKPNRWVEELK